MKWKDLKLHTDDKKKYYKNDDGKWVDLRTEKEKLSDERTITKQLSHERAIKEEKKQRRADLVDAMIPWVLGLVFAVAIMSAILD
ncbi:hypothetical protein [Candidatus Pelagibacter sp.]|uniref:hypothetical protein n=1 Tax=Candidatus Pelagibacter sp. TaxID=2024849 RepID=UPI003F86B1B3